MRYGSLYGRYKEDEGKFILYYLVKKMLHGFSLGFFYFDITTALTLVLIVQVCYVLLLVIKRPHIKKLDFRLELFMALVILIVLILFIPLAAVYQNNYNAANALTTTIFVILVIAVIIHIIILTIILGYIIYAELKKFFKDKYAPATDMSPQDSKSTDISPQDSKSTEMILQSKSTEN